MVDFVVLAVEQSFMSLMKNRSVGEFPLKRKISLVSLFARHEDKIAKKVTKLPTSETRFSVDIAKFSRCCEKYSDHCGIGSDIHKSYCNIGWPKDPKIHCHNYAENLESPTQPEEAVVSKKSHLS